MRYAASYKPDSEALDQFVMRKGGINACAARFTRALGRGAAPTDLDPQGLRSGDGRLFGRPYDMAVVPVADATFEGRVTRIHGLGPARRIEVTLGSEDGGVVDIDVPRSGEFAPGQAVGLKPLTYRIFAAAQ